MLKILKSRTVWASIVTLLALVVSQLTIDDQAILTNSVVNIIEGVCAIAAIIFRIFPKQDFTKK